jgi:RimJ/RimL family protein N-acetyltransferase
MMIGANICLGPVVSTDAPVLFGWVNTLRLVHASGAYRPTDEARLMQWLGEFSTDPSRVMFAIRRQGDLRLMGYVHFTGIHPILRSAELGICIGEPADQGQGFGQKAMGLALDYAWRELNLERVWLTVLSDNRRARRVYEKTGFQQEGELRRAAFADGGFRDLVVMAALRPAPAPPP